VRTERSGPVEIVPRVYGLGSEVVNWYLVEDGGRLVAVDAGLPAFRRDLDAQLAALRGSVAEVEAVVLTHSDADHTGLAATLQESGARVLIHAADEDTLRRPRPKSGDGSPVHVIPQLWRPQLWRTFVPMTRLGGARPPRVEGAEVFKHGDVLEVAGWPRVVGTPGHTPGPCAFLFEGRGALFVGDALCTWNPMTGRRGPLGHAQRDERQHRRLLRLAGRARGARRRRAPARPRRAVARGPGRRRRGGARGGAKLAGPGSPG
jgi:glyoxylase-like metal-dependent hydrolase (beta-lactamase superfamily II)